MVIRSFRWIPPNADVLYRLLDPRVVYVNSMSTLIIRDPLVNIILDTTSGFGRVLTFGESRDRTTSKNNVF